MSITLVKVIIDNNFVILLASFIADVLCLRFLVTKMNPVGDLARASMPLKRVSFFLKQDTKYSKGAKVSSRTNVTMLLNKVIEMFIILLLPLKQTNAKI